MFKNIADVQVGDTILDGGNRTQVTKIEIGPGGCRHKVHINQKDCYEGFTEVRVQDDNKESKNA